MNGVQCRALQPRQPGNRAYLGAYSSADIPADPLEAGADDAERHTASIAEEVAHPGRMIILHNLQLAIIGWVVSMRPLYDSASSVRTDHMIRSTPIDSTHCAHTCIGQCRLGTTAGLDGVRLCGTEVTTAWPQKNLVLHTSLQT